MSSTRVIAVQERAYRTLANATGRLMTATNEVPSLSLTADLSISIMDTLLQKVLLEAERDSEYRDQLSKAVKKRDRERIIQLFMDSLKQS